jgi:D-sedoheptulose 7-phosphate isomerase
MTAEHDAAAGWTGELDAAARALETVRASLPEIEAACQFLVEVLRSGGTIFACGNGGSALEAQHLAAELVGHFRRDRDPLSCVALSADSGVMTAVANDYDYRQVFARQLTAHGKASDALVAFSTSGTSPNVVEAVHAARTIGMRTVVLTGSTGGVLATQADRALVIRGADTQRAQEAHLLLVHLMAEYIDAALADDKP